MEIKAPPSKLKSGGKLNGERRLRGRGGAVGGEEEDTRADTSDYDTRLSLQIKALVVATCTCRRKRRKRNLHRNYTIRTLTLRQRFPKLNKSRRHFGEYYSD